MTRGTAFLAAVLVAGGCGSGAPPGPPVLPDECSMNEHCGDGVACTEDLCVVSVNARRVCQWIPRSDLCPFGQQCRVIGPGLSGCMFDSDGQCLYAVEGTPCSAPDDTCALGDGTCSGGRCRHPAKVCPERNCRTRAGCEPGTLKCRYQPFDDGTSCEADQSECTTDVCVAGSCKAGTNHCDCTLDSQCPAGIDVCRGRHVCDPAIGKCVLKGYKVCEHPGVCEDGVCNPLTGECEAFPAEDDAPCGPLTACRTRGLCRDGKCLDAALDCEDHNPCTQDGCDPLNGCTNTPSEGSACDDGDTCTDGDACAGGTCRPGPARDCDDGAQCTDDSCDPKTGCTHVSRDSGPCDAPDPCTLDGTCVAGKCVPGPARDCDDQNPCTDDACLPGLGCRNMPVSGKPCDDQDVCTLDGACLEGQCTSSKVLDCSDGNVCTADACDPMIGCTHPPSGPVPCDDNNPCTALDACDAGSCRPGPAVSCDDADPCTADACDPGSGCVHAKLLDCCGNHIVEKGEQCDEGPAGSGGCTAGCAFQVQDVVTLPELGRGVAVAWSDPAQAGLLGYERIAADGTRALVCRTISAYGVLGEAIPVADTTAPQFGAFLPTLLALEGTQTFLMVWYTSTGVEARILDTGCNQFWDSALEVPGETAGTGFVATRAFGRILLAWHGLAKSGLPEDSNWYSVLHLGRIVLDGPGSTFTAEETRFGGEPALRERTYSAGICAGAPASILTLAIHRTGSPNDVRTQVVPLYEKDPPGEPEMLTYAKGNFFVPPLCARRQGGGFLVLLGIQGYLDGYPVTILLSQGLGSDGKKEGDEQLLFPIPSGAGPFDVWFPFPGRLLATPDGYLLASPRFKTLDFAIQSNVRVSIADLDTSGAVTGDLADVAQVPVGTVRTLDASAWPSSQSILAWQEGPKAAEGSLDPGGRVRVLIRAKAP